jgi:hypothetical protein
MAAKTEMQERVIANLRAAGASARMFRLSLELFGEFTPEQIDRVAVLPHTLADLLDEVITERGFDGLVMLDALVASFAKVTETLVAEVAPAQQPPTPQTFGHPVTPPRPVPPEEPYIPGGYL